MSGLMDGMENGPGRGDMNGDEAQIWERPWTLEEMQQSSANWSLAADSGLFLFLQEFSQRMLSKTHEIEKQLDGLIRDTKATDSCLHTVFNDFLMLSNTQFIENRVYDEEVEDPAPKIETTERQPEPEKTREQKEAELIPKMQEAVNYGLKVLDSAFEQLDIKAGNSDSDDEEATDRVEPILEPKDLYVDRPLPYLIGSQLFMEAEDVGLGDLSSEEMSIDSDRDSVIESEDGKEEEDQSDEDFDQEGEDRRSIKKKSSLLSYEMEEDEDADSDIFGDSDKEDDDNRQNTGPSSFADELAARITGEPARKPEPDRTSLSSTSKKKSKAKKEAKPARPMAAVDDDNALFKAPKMEEEEDFNPFSGKGGLFSGGRGLFDDDDEGDLFSDAPKRSVPDEPSRNKVINSEPDNLSKKNLTRAADPEPSLFSSENDTDSMKSQENGTPVKPKSQAAPNQDPAGGLGGLFDDDEDDDFFSGKCLKKSSSAGLEKAKAKKTVDLFGGDEEEERDIFSERANAPLPTRSKNEAVEEPVKQSAKEKKKPVGGVSVFGPGTMSLPTASEEVDKSEEGFSSRSQSKPDTTSQAKAKKTQPSLFDEEEEEDLFASASKAKPSQSKVTNADVKKPVTSSLFSDDEDQWMSSKSSVPEVKPGGMKPSVSAPSSLICTKSAQKNSLFDADDEDDLFSAAKSSSQKKPQKVSLLFEDEDEDKGFLFGLNPPAKGNTPLPTTKASTEASPAPSLFDSEKLAASKELTDKASVQGIAVADKSAEVQSPSPTLEGAEAKKKPTGGVSLFGGINVLASKQNKSPSEEPGGDDDPKPKSSPVVERKEEKQKEEEVKSNKNISLFDDEEAAVDWSSSISIPSKPASKNTVQTPAEEQPRTKSTRAFQDEELLFSQTQQRDNDPDVDIFATPAKAVSTKPAAELAPTLFAEEEEDDLFSSVKPKVPPQVAEKTKKPSEEETTSQPVATTVLATEANLIINPAALLPGAVPRVPPGGVGVLPGLPSPSSSSEGPSPSPVTSPSATQDTSSEGVSFDAPAQVTTLQSANKARPKGSVRRRPQTRAARQLAAQVSEENHSEETQAEGPGPNPALPGLALPNPSRTTQDLPSPTPFSPALPDPGPVLAQSSKTQSTDGSSTPSDLTLPDSTDSKKPVSTKGGSMPVVPTRPDVDDLFASDTLFGSVPAPEQTAPSPKPKIKTAEGSAGGTAAWGKEKDASSSIFDDVGDDLFQKVKPRAGQKTKASTFLEEDNDEEDIFGMGKSSSLGAAPKSSKVKESSKVTKQDIFQDEGEPFTAANKKHKDKPLDASLFDDSADIFADLTVTSKPKHKSKKKVETKSIFDDDMDDIFSSNAGKAVAKPSVKSQKTLPSQQDSSARDGSTGNIFDDPLNALGGK